MLKLLRNVRKAYKQWRRLPDEERERFSGEVQRIRDLVRELGGARAVKYIEGTEENPNDDAEISSHPATRRRSEVIVELGAATSALAETMARPATKLAVDSVPRSVRLGGKAAAAGVRRLGRTRQGPGS